MKKWEAFN